MAQGTTKVRTGREGLTVDEGKKTCNCRMWQLSGIPYFHATKVIFLLNMVPNSYVPAWFKTDLYFVLYHHFLKPDPWRRKKQSVINLEDAHVDVRGTVSDGSKQGDNSGAQKGSTGAGGSKKGSACGSKQGSAGACGSKGCANAVGSKNGSKDGSKQGSERGSKRKAVLSAGT
ncbi:hypothetical protein Tco_0705103 [Tanacetum coccineum]|uniref:Zinc finger PMZ-type domain-containing protein n=1 Tax=Tanacetum coccineum TaxID=301880 RepID=A0ABQ4Y536_9ASTR